MGLIIDNGCTSLARCSRIGLLGILRYLCNFVLQRVSGYTYITGANSMSKQKYIQNNAGQHTIEYAMLLIIIMVGIVMGGPYVVRSWYAHVKGLEDSVVDSINDPLLQTTTQGSTPPFCNCGSFENQGCGFGVSVPPPYTWPLGNTPGLVQCAATEMLSMKTCSPLDCEWSMSPTPQIALCNTDPACCTPWTNTGSCGVLASGVSTANGGNPDGTCPDGYMMQSRTCGSSSMPDFRCGSDPACVFNCLGTPFTGPQFGPLCTNTSGVLDDQRLTADAPYVIVAAGVCTNATKCEFPCATGYVPTSNNCIVPPTNYMPVSCRDGFTENNIYSGTTCAGTCNGQVAMPGLTCTTLNALRFDAGSGGAWGYWLGQGYSGFDLPGNRYTPHRCTGGSDEDGLACKLLTCTVSNSGNVNCN